MKNSKLICLIVAFTMIAVQVSAKGGYKRKVELKKEWRVQTKSPQEVPLQAFLIENQQLIYSIERMLFVHDSSMQQ